MKILRRLLSLVYFAVGFASISATAGPMPAANPSYNYVDRDPDSGNGPLIFLSTSGTQSYSSTFQIFAPGFFNASTMEITAARVTFAFADDGDNSSEYVSVYLDGATWQPTVGQEIDGNHNNSPASFDYYSQTYTKASDYNFLQSLQDGILNYKVKVTSGDVYLKIAQLEATIVMRSSVPDAGTTLGLLAATLAGMMILKRRRLPRLVA